MQIQVVGCSHHNSTIDFREKLAFTAGQAREATRCLAAGLPGRRGRAPFHLQPRGVILRHGKRGRAVACANRRLPRPLSSSRDGRDRRAALPSWRRNGGAAPVYRSRQSRQHGARRAADSRPGEGRLRTGHAARQHGTALARGVPVGNSGLPAGEQRDGHPPAARERAQRGGGRFRPADFRTLRRQARRRHRRGRNGEGNAPLPPRRRRPSRSPSSTAASNGPTKSPRSGTAARSPGTSWPKRSPPPTSSSARPARRSRS